MQLAGEAFGDFTITNVALHFLFSVIHTAEMDMTSEECPKRGNI